MKKLIVLASLLICLILAACGAGDKETTDGDATKGTKAQSEGSTAATEETTTASEESTPAESETTTVPEESTTVPEETTPEATEPAFVPKGKVEIESIQVPSAYTLKELGPLAEGEGKLYFQTRFLYRYEKAEDDTKLLIPVDHMGKAISSERYGNIGFLNSNLLIVSSFEETINNSGLLSESGEMLIPCEAAIIRELQPSNSFDDAPVRFLMVIYGTEKTDKKEEAFFYATDAWFSIAPEEGDQYYKGYGKIYDLEQQRFVPELTITNPNKLKTSVCGSLIYTETPEGTAYVYNANGKEVFKYDGYVNLSLGNDFYLLDSKEVYDSEGELLYKLSGFDRMDVIKGSARFLGRYNSETKNETVCDYFGNELFDLGEGISFVSSEAGGLFACQQGDTAILYNAQGEVVFSQENSGGFPAYRGCGIWEIYAKDTDGDSTFFLTNGKTASGKRYLNNLINEVKEEQSGVFSFYPWNNPTEKVTYEWTYVSRAGMGLVFSSYKPFQLVDTFSGELLLEAEEIKYIDGYIYAKIDGVYQVFELVAE